MLRSKYDKITLSKKGFHGELHDFGIIMVKDVQKQATGKLQMHQK